MLRFTCPHCSAKLTAREERAGKVVLCPKCKGRIAVPHPPESEATALQLQRDFQPIEPPRPFDEELLQLKPEPARTDTAADDRRREAELRAFVLPPPEPEYTGQRTSPWPIDILLYPFSTAGLTTLAIVIVIPLLINLAIGVLGPFSFLIALPGALISGVISLYFVWYVTQCVQDSAMGGVRAPETISQAPGFWDMAVQLGRTLACIAVALLPLMIYWIRIQEVDTTFWSLLALAVALFPMAMLSVTVHDSISGLSPLIIIPSVFRTFLSYLLLVVVLGSLTFLLVGIWVFVAEDPVLSFTFGLARCYPILVAAHLLGRFYWRCKEKLDWAV